MDIQKMINDAVNRRVQELIEEQVRSAVEKALQPTVEKALQPTEQGDIEKALQPTEQGDLLDPLFTRRFKIACMSNTPLPPGSIVFATSNLASDGVARQVSGIELPPITNVQPLNQPTTQVSTNPPKPIVHLQRTLPLGWDPKRYAKRSRYRHFAGRESYLSVTNKKFKLKVIRTYIADVYAMCSELLSGGPATRRDLHLLIREQMPDLNESTLSSCLTKLVASKHLIVVPDPSVAKGF